MENSKKMKKQKENKALTKEDFDLVVIGSGPGGYVAALRAAQLGLKTACIEKEKTFGGTCLNKGCIPSKALLESSYLYYKTQNELDEHGVQAVGIKLNVEKMLNRKNQVVKQLTKGIEFLFKKGKVTSFLGQAHFKSSKELLVQDEKGNIKALLSFRSAIIASGSVHSELPSEISPPIDEKVIVSSTGALNFNKPPQELIVVGGGYIGLEMGSVWSRLGSKVKIIESAESIISLMDSDLIQGLYKSLQKQGLEFFLNTAIKKIEKTKTQGQKQKEGEERVSLNIESVGGKKETLKADALLLSVGRKPHTEGLGLDEIGVKKDEKGFILVGENYETHVPHIFAIGDVIGGLMLAHKAEQEGIACVELITGQKPSVSYPLIPSVLYTHPEVASVGLTEREVKEKNIPYKVGKSSYKANGRALSMNEKEGFVKILIHSQTNEILGAHIFGASASEMIHEFCLSMEFSATHEDLFLTTHAHPTLSEVIKEASLSLRH